MDTTTRARSHRVLVVEDDRAVRELTVTRVRNLGCEVIEARDGVQALAVLDSGERVDLIFTDLIMPGGVSGLDLCEIARTRWPHIRLLLTSGYAEELTNPERFERLKLKLLRKPYRQAELAEAIEAVMSA
jgi:CheY-like chemotaxis protein